MKNGNKLAFIGLGANLGQPRETFKQACILLEQEIGQITAKSSLYTSSALLAPGNSQPQPDYLNAVVRVATNLSPTEILAACNEIESTLGRVRVAERWQPRIIDLDLLALDEVVVSDGSITLPHPQLHLRDFVLAPLCEISPNWRHPVLKIPAIQLLEKLTSLDRTYVKAKEQFIT